MVFANQAESISLRLGAKICGVPAHDWEFGTIDFLILLDMREIPERYARRFLI